MGWGSFTWGGRTWAAQPGVSGAVRTPLPGFYVDNLRFDDTVDNLALINTLPQSGEERVRSGAHITFNIAAIVNELDNTHRVWVTIGDNSEVLAYDEAGAGFQNGFAGSSSSIAYSQSPGSGVNDTVKITLDPEVDYPSNTLVTVRLSSEAGGAADTLETSYSFTTEYTEAPVISDMLWLSPRKVRVEFRDEMEVGTEPGETLYLKTLTGGMEFVAPESVSVRNLTPTTDWVGYWLGTSGSAYPQNNGYFKITAVDSANGLITVDNSATADFISDDGIDKDADGNVVRNRPLRGVISSYALFADPASETDTVTCAYAPVIVGVREPDTTEIPLGSSASRYAIWTLHDDISISRKYTAHLAVAKSIYNDAADATSVFGFTSPSFGSPIDRVKVWDLMLGLDKEEDAEEDDQLQKMACVLQDMLNVMWYRCDTLQYLNDPTLAPDSWIPYLLYTLGNPFRLPLTTLEQRRLCDVLASVYKGAGTAKTIEDTLEFFLGTTFTVTQFVEETWWSLGTAVLGTSTTLGPSSKFAKNSYQITAGRELTSEEERFVVSVAETLDPVYMHLIRVNTP